MNFTLKSGIISLALLTIIYGQLHGGKPIKLKQIGGPASYPLWSKKNEAVSSLRSIWVSSDRQCGWAVGEKGMILKYNATREGDKWKVIYKPGQITSNHLYTLWMDGKGEHGWIVGEKGMILEYNAKREGDKWKVIHKPGQITSNHIYALWMDGEGEHGWAVGEKGTILEYNSTREGDKWKVIHKPGQIISNHLFALWMDSKGEHGWAVGERGMILEYNATREGNKWKIIHRPGQITSNHLYALWMDGKGEHGWAVGTAGTILEYDAKKEGEKWKVYSQWKITLKSIRALWMDSKGEHGWAVGSGGTILEYDAKKEGEKWKVYSQGKITFNHLFAIWMDGKGEHGWAVGERGTILEYDVKRENEKWKVVLPQGQITSKHLTALWMDGKGEHGWAVSESDTILEYDAKREGEKWKVQSQGQITSKNLSALWMDSKGEHGWAIGERGTILEYDANREGDKWKVIHKPGQITSNHLFALWMDGKGDHGWAVGTGGTILEYDVKREGEKWKVHSQGQITTNHLVALWVDGKRDHGWAIGYGGTILEYDVKREGEKWEVHSQGQITSNHLVALWVDGKRDHGWAVGYGGTILEYDVKKEGEKWKVHSQGQITSKHLYALWMDGKGDHGWAMGENGIILEYDAKGEGKKWKVIHKPGQMTRNSIRALWMDSKGEHGWAVGIFGTILQYQGDISLKPACTISMKNTLIDLSGLLQLKFEHNVQEIIVELINVTEGGIDLLQSKRQLFSTVAGKNTGNWAFEFGNNSKLVNNFQEDECYLKFTVALERVPLKAVYRTETFNLKAKLKINFIIWFILSLLCLNLMMALLSIPFSKVRTFILHAQGLTEWGFFVGKYLIIYVLIYLFKVIRLGFFMEYRKELKKVPFIEQWYQGTYIAPRIKIAGSTIDSNGTVDTWQNILKTVLTGSKSKLWLIKGKSGLGKTALLENWAKLALEMGETPIFIPLGSDMKPKEEVKAIIEQYGDIDVEPKVALNLLKRGGFLILLDGLNEDRRPDLTRKFVGQVCKHNHVVITSQFKTGWEKSLRIEEIDLKPFGKEQLEAIMAPEWVDKLLESDFRELANLPHTAQLIGEYIEENQILPTLHLDIYRNLRKDFDRDSQAINLEEKAWQMFTKNEKMFKTDNKMPAKLCESAVGYGILTRQMKQYKFRHDRVSRYFAACYLSRHNKKPLEEWHRQLESHLGRNYWADTLELWGEIYAESAVNDPTKEPDFIAFMKESGKFECHVFKQRLYPLYERLISSGKLQENSEFIRCAANLMANC